MSSNSTLISQIFSLQLACAMYVLWKLWRILSYLFQEIQVVLRISSHPRNSVRTTPINSILQIGAQPGRFQEERLQSTCALESCPSSCLSFSSPSSLFCLHLLVFLLVPLVERCIPCSPCIAKGVNKDSKVQSTCTAAEGLFHSSAISEEFSHSNFQFSNASLEGDLAHFT